MKTQCHNPYLPLYEHIPDGEPHVFGDRLYVYGSHDLENGNEFCELDYVAWSAPTNDLSDWRFDGVIYRKDQDPYNKDVLPLYAPDVVKGPDGRYYLYYCIKFQDSINVAVCDTPAGAYEFYGRVHYTNGEIMAQNQPYDPSLICCEEGNFLYFGFAPCMINIPRYKDQDLKGGSVLQLEDDMLTIKAGPTIVAPSLKYGKGTSFEGNEYFEGPSIRKIRNKFYLIYSSVHTHQLCYAISDKPMEGFTYAGVVISNGDVGYEGREEQDKVMLFYLIFMALIPHRIVYAALAAFVAALYAEIISGLNHTPATYYLYPTIIPLIPGDLFYYLCAGLVTGNAEMFRYYAIECTLALVGLGIGFVVCSCFSHYMRIKKLTSLIK